MRLFDLLDQGLLNQALREGYVKQQAHPTQPNLKILNYTEKTQFSQWWNGVTLKCRGLIYDSNTGEIIARPFEKFFNWGERWESDQVSMTEPVVVTDKLDGSLGIVFQDNHLYLQVATRGSFTSTQALHATELINQGKYAQFMPRHGLTYLVEIIYPENQIVVNYHGADDLFLIGVVDNETGAVFGPEMAPEWPGPRTGVMTPRTMEEVLSMDPRPGKEGVVVRVQSDGLMFKVKQQEYIELHRIVTNLNPKTIWQRCYNADTTLAPELSRKSAVLDGLPDEFYDSVWGTANELFKQKYRMEEQVYAAWKKRPYVENIQWFNERDLRRQMAAWIKQHERWLQSALWLLYDGHREGLREFLWKQIKPRGEDK